MNIIASIAFVLLWSSGAIVSGIGLRHGSPFALLIFRYVLALSVFAMFAAYKGKHVFPRENRTRAVLVGFFVAGLNSICYLLALDHGMTPGALATVLGIQPIVTLFIVERRVSIVRCLGLLLAFIGLIVVVSDGLTSARFELLGVLFAALSLLGITIGSIIQKKETRAPWEVLPLQYLVGIIFAAAMSPYGGIDASWDWGFVLSVGWLGLVISVGTTSLLYGLIARGNLVSVTGLFYVTPGVTAALDWIILKNPMSFYAIFGLFLVLAGLIIADKFSKAGEIGTV